MQNSLFVDLQVSLQKCGPYKRRSAIIGKFVDQCLGLAHAAHDNLRGPKWSAFLQKKGAVSKTTTGAPRVKETALSADIALEAMALLKKGVQRQSGNSSVGFPRDAISCVQADALTPSKNATGNSSKRPDLVFMPADAELNLAFAVEAKVLEGPRDCKDVLLGSEGVGCFTRPDDPYETNGVIGLFGYAADADVGSHSAALHSAMVADVTTGFVGVSTALRDCSWNSVTTPRESTLATTTNSGGMVCLGVVLGFPSIRQGRAASATKTAKAKSPPLKRAVNVQAPAPAGASSARRKATTSP